MNIVIAGYGVAGESHAALLADRPDIRITGVADHTAARRDAARARYPGAAVATGLDDLTVPADAVVVCTPPARHEADTLTALTRLHANVLCEKPAVLEPAGGRRLADIAARAGLLLQPVHNYLHSPAIDTLRATAARELTHLSHIAIDIIRTGPAHGHHAWRPLWRTDPTAGGGILNDHGPHACYLACHLAGKPAVTVACSTTPGNHGADHEAQVRLRFADNTTATITLSWRGTSRVHSYELHGAQRSVRLRNGQLTLSTPTGAQTWATEDHSLGGPAHTAWTKAVHQEFLDRLTGSSHTHDTWAMAVHVAQILHAATVSAATDQRHVTISLIESGACLGVDPSWRTSTI